MSCLTTRGVRYFTGCSVRHCDIGGSHVSKEGCPQVGWVEVRALMTWGWSQNDLGRNDLGRNDLGRNDLGRNDLGRNDLGRNDLGRNDLGRNDLGRNELGRNELGRISGLGDDRFPVDVQ